MGRRSRGWRWLTPFALFLGGCLGCPGACSSPNCGSYFEPYKDLSYVDVAQLPPRIPGADGVATGECSGGQRSCYGGPPATENIGSCAPGTQSCSSVEGGTWSDCTGQTLPSGADRCVDGHGVDDDCDGFVDESICCPQGSKFTQTFTVRPPVPFSAVVPGSTWALLASVLACSAPLSCNQGEVVLDTGVTQICLTSPAPCDGAQALWYAGTEAQPTGFQCLSCPYVVQFGGIFAGARHCAEAPIVHCPNGEVPTYDPKQLTWICAPMCNDGDYDIHSVDGTTVCVPC
jgi:hypothetical protein